MSIRAKKSTPEHARYVAMREHALALVREGLTFAEAAAESGAGLGSVRNWCRKERVSLTPEARARSRFASPPPPSPATELRDLVNRRKAEFAGTMSKDAIVGLVAAETELTINEVREALA